MILSYRYTPMCYLIHLWWPIITTDLFADPGGQILMILPCPFCQVFGDRLTDNQDSKWMTSQIKSILDHLGSVGTAQCIAMCLEITTCHICHDSSRPAPRPLGRQFPSLLRVESLVVVDMSWPANFPRTFWYLLHMLGMLHSFVVPTHRPIAPCWMFMM